MSIQAPKGTKDIFGKEVFIWQEVESAIIKLCRLYSIEEMRTPIFEHTELFSRGVGETTDIVQKEMYTFMDKGDRSITLRPEGTAPIVRSYLENGLFVNKQPTKFFYVAPMFRYEQPQSGRYRQFHQFGIEYFGSNSPASDAEVISVAYNLFKILNVENISLNINSLGGPLCREKYNLILKDYLKANYDNLCPTCHERFEKNPLRVLDCKEEACKKIVENAPTTIDVLDKECLNHFETLQSILNELNIPFKINPKIVRGLDYYTKTVFEFVTEDKQRELTVCGGGRYDGLVKELGGQETSGIGFGIGLERLVNLLLNSKENDFYNPVCDIYIGSIGENGFIKSQGIANELRAKGFICESDIVGRGVKAQMKYANKLNCRFSFILGDEEIKTETIQIRNMETGENTQIKLDQLTGFLKKLNK